MNKTPLCCAVSTVLNERSGVPVGSGSGFFMIKIVFIFTRPLIIKNTESNKKKFMKKDFLSPRYRQPNPTTTTTYHCLFRVFLMNRPLKFC